MWTDARTATSDLHTPDTDPSDEPTAELSGVHWLETIDDAAIAPWEDAGFLVTHVEDRSRFGSTLAELLEERTELELQGRGGQTPGLGADASLDDALSDQLFRARRIGHTGIALVLRSLDAQRGADGALGPDDVQTLVDYARACDDRPFALVLPESERSRPAHVNPESLLDAFDAAERAPKAAAPLKPSTLERIMPINPIELPELDDPALGLSDDAVSRACFQGPAAVIEAAQAPEATDRIEMGPLVELPWRVWTEELEEADGPQPLGAFERLFEQCYMPLVNALRGGVDSERARAAATMFRETFARAYREALPSFPLTGRRPKMVLDAPTLASRFAQTHAARKLDTVLVDGMRWDVGERVRAQMSKRAGGRISLVEQTLLYSALPSTTARQLEVIARGLDALTELPREDVPQEPVRVRTADTLRPVRVGNRTFLKLDTVETSLRSAERVDDVTLDRVATRVADQIEQLADATDRRTLVFVFGDHGFLLGADGQVRHGGAAPEEVLVPAYAFLVDDVH